MAKSAALKPLLWLAAVVCVSFVLFAVPRLQGGRELAPSPAPAAVAAADPMRHWLASGHESEVAHLQQFLAQHKLEHVLPMPQLLSVSRDWFKCDVPPYAIAPSPLWPNMLPTLRLFETLQQRNLLSTFEVTSSYRDAALNTCAGGRPASSHLQNAALDLRLTSLQAEGEITALCEFWKQEGAAWSMGLGFYADNQLHIDTRGYRTWGADTRRNSSPCR